MYITDRSKDKSHGLVENISHWLKWKWNGSEIFWDTAKHLEEKNGVLHKIYILKVGWFKPMF